MDAAVRSSADSQMSAHVLGGRGALLTEDPLASASRWRSECPLARRRRSWHAEKLDLVVDGLDRTFIELMYPRGTAHVFVEMRRRGTTYAESTVRTVLSSHMCVDLSGPGVATHADVERMGRGSYRLRPGHWGRPRLDCRCPPLP
jgi:hypothetical protein